MKFVLFISSIVLAFASESFEDSLAFEQEFTDSQHRQLRRSSCRPVNCEQDGGITLQKKLDCSGEGQTAFNCVAADGTKSLSRPSQCDGTFYFPCGGSCSDENFTNPKECKQNGADWVTPGRCDDPAFASPKDCKQGGSTWRCPGQMLSSARRLRRSRCKPINCLLDDGSVILEKKRECSSDDGESAFNCQAADGSLSVTKPDECDGTFFYPCGGACEDGSGASPKECKASGLNFVIPGSCDDGVSADPKACKIAEGTWTCPDNILGARRLGRGRRGRRGPINCQLEGGFIVLEKKSNCSVDDGETPFTCQNADGSLSLSKPSDCDGTFYFPCGGSCSDGTDSNPKDCKANGGSFDIPGSCSDSTITDPKACHSAEGSWTCPASMLGRRLRGGRGGKRFFVNCQLEEGSIIITKHRNCVEEDGETAFTCKHADDSLSVSKPEDCDGVFYFPCGGICADNSATNPEECKANGSSFTVPGECSDTTLSDPKACKQGGEMWICPADLLDTRRLMDTPTVFQ